MFNIDWPKYIEKTENGYKIKDDAFQYRDDIKNIVIIVHSRIVSV